MVVPATKAEVQAADEGHLVVDDNELLVMRPVEGHVGSVLKNVMVRMAHDPYVTMPGRSLRAKSLERMLRVLRVAGQRSLDFAIDHDEDLDAGLGPPLQDLIQPPFLVVVWGPPEE